MSAQNSEVFLFTGAGASMPLGFPTTFDFFNNDPDNIISPLARFFVNMQTDVETVLDLLNGIQTFKISEPGKFFELVSQHTINAYTEYDLLEKKIKDRCRKLYSTTPSLENVRRLFLPLFDALEIKKKRIDFFTTNYDPTTDVILELMGEMNVTSTDGFDGHGLWKPELFERDYHFRLFRLHGSMCYIKQVDNRIRNIRHYDPGLNPADQLLLYPGYKGDPSKADDIYRIPYLEFSKSLASCQLAVFIGFSFRDLFINLTIEKLWNNKVKPSLIIWNPISREELEKNLPQGVKFRHRVELFDYTHSNISQFQTLANKMIAR
jgi:hypothetical protein